MGTDRPGDGHQPTVRIVRPDQIRPPAAALLDIWEKHFADAVLRCLEPAKEPVLALDLACGRGNLAIAVADKLPTGSRLIALCEDRGDLRRFHERLDARLRKTIFPRKETRHRLPFALNIFDLAWASLATDRLDKLRPSLRQALRVLRPGGQLVVVAPLHDTFVELANAVTARLDADTQILANLTSGPALALDRQSWLETLERCGGIEVAVDIEQFELSLTPPLSSQPLLSQYLLPLWLGDDPTVQAKALRLFDQRIAQPVVFTASIATLRCRRGYVEIEDSNA